MRTILLFNDNSRGTVNAGKLALRIAQKVKADILLLNLCKVPHPAILVDQVIGSGNQTLEKTESPDLVSYLADDISDGDFRPVIAAIDASTYTEQDIVELVIRKNIWLMIKNIGTRTTRGILPTVDVQAVINRVACPLLLAPDTFTAGNFEYITYTLDMRYCRMAVLRFLVELARGFGASLVIQHFSAKGLPHLNDSYARELFEAEVARKIKYDKIYFNNIKERNLSVAVDVMVDDLHADLLALVNHRFHFEELFGRSIKSVLPAHVRIPVIVFPL
ncbi:MAG: hypothetical protein JSU01_02215 [Bacteroidetes bacterium]|nr:hypothetical protein [Bacteroidota bacterium]